MYLNSKAFTLILFWIFPSLASAHIWDEGIPNIPSMLNHSAMIQVKENNVIYSFVLPERELVSNLSIDTNHDRIVEKRIQQRPR